MRKKRLKKKNSTIWNVDLFLIVGETINKISENKYFSLKLKIRTDGNCKLHLNFFPLINDTF